MRTSNRLTIALLTALALLFAGNTALFVGNTACAATKTKSKSKTTTTVAANKTKTVAAKKQKYEKQLKRLQGKTFSSITMTAAATLYLHYSNSPRIVVTGMDKPTKDLEFICDNNSRDLTISFQNDNDRNGNRNSFNSEDFDFEIHIYQPSFSSITITGLGDLHAEGKLPGNDITMTVTGVGNLNLNNISVKNLNINMTGVGTADISGHAESATLTLTGVAQINALDFKVNNLVAVNSGIGDLYCNAVKIISAHASGYGKIYYSGNPDTENLFENDAYNDCQIINYNASSGSSSRSSSRSAKSKKSEPSKRHQDSNPPRRVINL